MYEAHEKNYRFFLSHLNHIGMTLDMLENRNLTPYSSTQCQQYGYNKTMLTLWLTGYYRSKEGMLEHAQSA